MESLVAFVRSIDPQGVLAPYLEGNAAEFVGLARPFPADAELRDWRAMAGLGGEVDAELLGLARDVRADHRLAFLHFHCRRLAYGLRGLYGDGEMERWPSFDAVLPGRGGTFLLLVGLCAVPLVRRMHAILGVAADITRDTCGDIGSRVLIGREFRHGELGVTTRCLRWLRLHARGELFQIGRLQFHPTILCEPVRIYRHRDDGRVLILLEPGLRLTPEGYFDGAGGRLHPQAWESDWREADGRITATAILDTGLAGRKPLTINVSDWKWVADGASAVMNTHIPRGPRIAMADWQSSIRRGFEFFRTIRPVAAQPVACACKSWMFDPRLRELLPADAGLVALQRRVSAFPLCTADAQCGLYFMFGADQVDLAAVPQDTSLRRAVVRHLTSGGFLSGGGMVVFEDQLGNFS